MTRLWSRRGSRPRAARDRRFTRAHPFGAARPSRGVGAAIVMPEVNIAAMNERLAVIGRAVPDGVVAAVVLDGAGWHGSPRPRVPDNIALVPPPYAPEPNPVENIWAYPRANFLGHRAWDGYAAIVDACCDAWNKLTAMPDVLTSITNRQYAQVRT